MRGGDFFLDTNVVAYAFDPREPNKREVATVLMEKAENGKGCISFQVVQEFIKSNIKETEQHREAHPSVRHA